MDNIFQKKEIRVAVVGRNLDDLLPMLKMFPCKIVEEAPDLVISHGGDGALLGAERQFPGVPKCPLRDHREIWGKYDDIMLKSNYEGTNREDYIHVILTDEDDIPDAMARLRVIYPNVMKITYDNMRTRNFQQLDADNDISSKSQFQLFSEFYKKQNGSDLSDEQEKYIKKLIESIWEGRK